MSNELAVPAPLGVLDVINTAVVNNASVEVLERLYALMERQNAAQAKSAFDAAMAGFQGECPVIAKSADGARTRSGGVAYHYAPLDKIVTAVRSLLAKYGLSYSFDTVNDDTRGTIQVICTAKHTGGHSESSTVLFRIGTKTELMSLTQQDAATVTYSKRYAFCNVFGIMTGDSDTDLVTEPIGYAEAPIKYVDPPVNRHNFTEKQRAEIAAMQAVIAAREATAEPSALDKRVASVQSGIAERGEWQITAGRRVKSVRGEREYDCVVYTLAATRPDADNVYRECEATYWQYANAVKRCAPHLPEEYRGTISCKLTDDKGKWSITELQYPELVLSDSDGNLNALSPGV